MEVGPTVKKAPAGNTAPAAAVAASQLSGMATAWSLQSRIEAALTASMNEFCLVSGQHAGEVEDLASAAANLATAGGKRIRPRLFYWGWRVGQPDCDEIIDLAIAMEIFHLFALVHDDLIDRSDVRRGVPTAHHQLASMHRNRGWRGDAAHFGLSSGILLGDALMVWADVVIGKAVVLGARAETFRRAYDAMRLELVAGQYLDVISHCTDTTSMTAALRMARLKSGNYSIGHPLRLGAIAGGVGSPTIHALGVFGAGLGEAFQIRDDILGVFGSPEKTGKPVGDDLRQGKRTVLVASALDRASPVMARRLRGFIGDPGLTEAEVDEAREIIISSGALDAVRGMLADRADAARRTLAAIRLDQRIERPLTELIDLVSGEPA